MKKVTRAVGLRRLAKLADFLEKKVPARKFDYSTWSTPVFTRDARTHLELDHACGTTGCAMGWAPSVPGFRRAGLRLVRGIPALGRKRRMGAAASFFGLSFEAAGALFAGVSLSYTDADMRRRVAVMPEIPSSSPRLAVVRRIRRFIQLAKKEGPSEWFE